MIPGYIIRCASPAAFDRVLAVRFATEAFNAIEEGDFGKMAAHRMVTWLGSR